MEIRNIRKPVMTLCPPASQPTRLLGPPWSRWQKKLTIHRHPEAGSKAASFYTLLGAFLRPRLNPLRLFDLAFRSLSHSHPSKRGQFYTGSFRQTPSRFNQRRVPCDQPPEHVPRHWRQAPDGASSFVGRMLVRIANGAGILEIAAKAH
jgi:hypothetical protein